jgi:regulatory protein
MRSPGKRKDDRGGLWEYALRALAGRAYSTGELERKLARRAERQEDVGSVLAQLTEKGYLNDRRFAENYAAARLDNDRLGKTRVLRELRQRRVAADTSERTVQHVYRDVDETALIESWIRAKYRTAPREGLFQEEKDLAAAYRRLVRAGFRPGDVITVLKRVAKNPERLDDFEPPQEMEEEA